MEIGQGLREKYVEHMEYCIGLAKKSMPKPNQGYTPKGYYIGKPYVGAIVLDKNGKIIGEGYKSFLGGTSLLQHAERMALDSFAVDGRAITLISTLQPCLQKSRKQLFEPCNNLIVKKGVKTVVFGVRDDVSFDSYAGINYLLSHGVEVVELEEMQDKIKKELMNVDVFQDRSKYEPQSW